MARMENYLCQKLFLNIIIMKSWKWAKGKLWETLRFRTLNQPKPKHHFFYVYSMYMSYISTK